MIRVHTPTHSRAPGRSTIHSHVPGQLLQALRQTAALIFRKEDAYPAGTLLAFQAQSARVQTVQRGAEFNLGPVAWKYRHLPMWTPDELHADGCPADFQYFPLLAAPDGTVAHASNATSRPANGRMGHSPLLAITPAMRKVAPLVTHWSSAAVLGV